MKRVILAALCATGALAAPVVTYAQPAGSALKAVPIRGNVFMIVGGGSIVTVSAGADGMLLVDTGPAATADRMLETIKEIGSFEEMIAKGKRMALRHGLAAAGSKLVVMAGVPFGVSGATNLLHVVTVVGDELDKHPA